MNLMKDLPKIAARVLHNTRSVHSEMKSKLQLIGIAYGDSAVARDFEKWCEEHTSDHFQYPISEYLKVIDSRLGGVPEEKRADLKDPAVAELVSYSYELTSVLPSISAVAELLVKYPADEIKAALHEFADSLTENEVKGSMRAFYSNGGTGAEAIILARRRRAQNVRS